MMRTVSEILAAHEGTSRALFRARVREEMILPEGMTVPDSPVEALRMGMQIGRMRGYGDGLTDGVELGLDVGMEALDSLMEQTVVFTTDPQDVN